MLLLVAETISAKRNRALLSMCLPFPGILGPVCRRVERLRGAFQALFTGVNVEKDKRVPIREMRDLQVYADS